MEKLKMHSPDRTQENIAKIRELFPGCVTEAKDENGKLRYAVDFDQLRQELSDHIVEGPQERYHLNWPGKREALLAANAPIAKTLCPCRAESVNFDGTRNLFIEGENLEALKLLQDTFLGRVKMIYIDPPYNTGNDFIYADDYGESGEDFLVRSNQVDDQGNRLVANQASEGRFHSNWLTMIYPRLRLARSLLREDGVIFISIDDHECHNLRKIGDEIFGEENFVSTFVRRRRMSTGMRDTAVSPDHEYVLAYARDIGQVALFGATRNEADYPYRDDVSSYRSTDLTVGMTRDMRPNQFYAIYHPEKRTEYWPPDSRVWRFEPSTMAQQIKDQNIIWPDDNPERNMMRPRFKTRYTKGEVKHRPISSWIQNKTSGENSGDEAIVAGLNQEGTKELRELFGEQTLEYPKPLSLLQSLVKISTRETDIVLDFFAGSGTTGHAVFSANSDDGSNRKFILVQFPEETGRKDISTIAELTKERIRRAGEKVISNDSHAGWNKDVGFRVLKIDTSNMADVYYTPSETKQEDLLSAVDNIKEGRNNPEDLLFQVLVDWGVDLTLPIRSEAVQGKKVFFVNEEPYDLIACFDTGVTEELVKELAKHEPVRVVFRDNGFASDAVKINVEQIFRQLSPATDVKSI
ncbi:MAG: site-specific DNA-methyltransferase [Pseudomonadota bacterium]|nr:site-specific DNA-methyltransferase [Pseudomonadota bacterium]